ncbi:hypothetical protein [Sandaracinus amylolyticus]|uniref:hypothetical protein n=1 Tax=Sandaracinus amylolyticus TaxID=927083 RepID=UPI0012EECB48
MIRAPELPKLEHRLAELRRSASTDGKGRIPFPDWLVAPSALVRHDRLTATRTEERGASRSDFGPRFALLARDLFLDRSAHLLGAPAARDARERAELELDRLRPLLVLWVEEHRRTTRLQHTASDVARSRLYSRPLSGFSHESGEHRIRNGIGALLHDRVTRTEHDDRRGLVIPNRALPSAKDLRPERDPAMQIAQEIRENAGDVGDDEVLVRAHQRRDVDDDPVFARGHCERVNEQAPHLLVGAKEMMTTKGAARDQDGGAWEDDAWLCHAAALSND